MRILLVGYLFPPEVQSMAVMLDELAEDLAVRGHDVTVVTGFPNHPRGVLFDGWRLQIRTVSTSPRGFRIVRCAHAVHPRKTLLRRSWHYLSFAISSAINAAFTGAADVVVSMSTPIFGALAAWLVARAKGAAFVYEIDDVFPEAARNLGVIDDGLAFRALLRLDTSLCAHSTRVVTLAAGLRASLLARGLPPDLVAEIPFWIDTDKIQPRVRLNAWRRRAGIADDDFAVLYAGTIGLTSGATVLVDAAAALRDRRDVVISCVGEGVVRDRVLAEARARGLANIRFFPFQPAEVFPDVLAASDAGLVTLLPKAADSSIPSKVLAYLAAGRMVIASVPDSSGTAAMIREGECGTVTRSQDGAALAGAILGAAADREAARRMGARGRRYVTERFSRSRCTRAYEALLLDASRHRGKAR